MLRAPGTTNTKYTIPYRVSITQDSGQVYKLAEIEEAYKDISVEKAKKLVAVTGGEDNTIPDVLPRLSDTLDKLLLPMCPSFIELDISPQLANGHNTIAHL